MKRAHRSLLLGLAALGSTGPCFAEREIRDGLSAKRNVKLRASVQTVLEASFQQGNCLGKGICRFAHQWKQIRRNLFAERDWSTA